MKRINYSYHLVENSAWPLTTSISVLSLIIGFIMSMQLKQGGYIITVISFLSLIYSIKNWWGDIIIEGSYKGEHTKIVKNNLNVGFILFVFSEVLIFASFFFAFFYVSFIPSVEFSSIWPPIGLFIS